MKKLEIQTSYEDIQVVDGDEKNSTYSEEIIGANWEDTPGCCGSITLVEIRLMKFAKKERISAAILFVKGLKQLCEEQRVGNVNFVLLVRDKKFREDDLLYSVLSKRRGLEFGKQFVNPKTGNTLIPVNYYLNNKK